MNPGLARSSVWMTAVLMVAGCKAGSGQTPPPNSAHPAASRAFCLHAHNDYEHEHPLQDALAQGFDSVEADLFWDSSEIQVAHYRGTWRGTLRALYLDPLQAKVTEQGSVHGDGRTFFLWLDLKENDARLGESLVSLLQGYSMLDGPVTVVLTGSDALKKSLMEGPLAAKVYRDSNDWSPEDPAAGDSRWRFYALNWTRQIPWAGEGEPPAAVRETLVNLVADAHRKGRRVRFWKTPQNAGAWGLLRDAGADFLQADQLEALARFARGEGP
jgi:hypothetical protein